MNDDNKKNTNLSPKNRIKAEKKWGRHRILTIFARLILGGIFVFASVGKILHPEEFAQAIYNYQILPDVFINLTAIVLPWLELVLGSFLIIGLWVPGTVVLSNLLLMTFIGALLFNITRGLDIGCGCFSSTTESTMNIWTVLRDISFLIPAGYLFYVTFLSFNRQVFNRGNDKSR